MSGERCPRCARETCKPHLFRLRKIGMYVRADEIECDDALLFRAKAAEAERDAMRPVVEAAERQRDADAVYSATMQDASRHDGKAMRAALDAWLAAAHETQATVDTYRLARGKAGM